MSQHVSSTLESTVNGQAQLLGNAGALSGLTLLASRHARVRGFAASDQTGTIFIDQSLDGTTWYNVNSVAVPGSVTSPRVGVELESQVCMPFVRVRYVNGATPQTAFVLTSALVEV